MTSARQRDVATAQKYARDANHLLLVAKANGLNVDCVSPWKDVLVESPQIFRGLNENGRSEKTPLQMVDALMGLCGVSRNSIDFGPLYVLQKLIKYEKSHSVKDLIEAELFNFGLAESQVRNLMTKINAYNQREIAKFLSPISGETPLRDDISNNETELVSDIPWRCGF